MRGHCLVQAGTVPPAKSQCGLGISAGESDIKMELTRLTGSSIPQLSDISRELPCRNCLDRSSAFLSVLHIDRLEYARAQQVPEISASAAQRYQVAEVRRQRSQALGFPIFSRLVWVAFRRAG